MQIKHLRPLSQGRQILGLINEKDSLLVPTIKFRVEAVCLSFSIDYLIDDITLINLPIIFSPFSGVVRKGSHSSTDHSTESEAA